MLRSIFITVVSILFCQLLLAETPEEKGLRISKEVEKANEGFIGEISQMELLLINATGEKTTRKMNTMVKERLNEGDMSLNIFLWPADVKGTKMLTHAFKEKADDQWLFMPAIKRVKRISSRNKSGSFMGSEFSYEDIGSQEPEKFTHKFIADGKLGGREVYKVERYPKDEYSAYSKQVLLIDKEYMNAVKIDYYDRKGELLKVSVFQGYKKIFKNLFRPDKIHIKNVQTKKESILTWTKRELGKAVPNNRFDSTGLSGEGV